MQFGGEKFFVLATCPLTLKSCKLEHDAEKYCPVIHGSSSMSLSLSLYIYLSLSRNLVIAIAWTRPSEQCLSLCSLQRGNSVTWRFALPQQESADGQCTSEPL